MPLSQEERIPELASMLGGVSETNRESAAELVRQAIGVKRGIETEDRLAGEQL